MFISSAQSNEGGTAWSEVRKSIKDILSQCVYLNPFIIEDEASTTPSNQFFLRQVERADVIVLLVKGEVRSGTATEYALAVKLKKPMLVYFIEDDNPNLEVIKLKKDVQSFDRCTYHPVSNFDNIDEIVRNDIMYNIVRTFQDKYYISQLENDVSLNMIVSEGNELQSSGIPSKTEISMFNSCYNYLFEQLDFSFFKKDVDESELHGFGCSLLNWLVSGKWEVKDEEIIHFISKCSEVFLNIECLQRRWDAIRSYIHGDLTKALSDEEDALRLARKAKESSWIINNILIDCRNLEIDIYNQNRRSLISTEYKGKYQEELAAQNTTVSLPVLDRYRANICEQIEKDEFKIKTANPYTEFYGTNLPNALIDLANYLFAAVIYGSNTHIQITRKIFANILERYSKLIDDPALAFTALRQYVLFGDTKDFKLYASGSWDTQYSFIASQADEVWKLTDLTPIINRDAMKQSVFALLGLYLTDSVFADAAEYILNYSNSVNGNNSELYFEALLTNLPRINPDRIIQIITPIIAEKRFWLGNKLSHIILYINLEQVSDQSLQKLANALKEQLPAIISTNGDPQMIAALMDRSRTIFGDLESLDGNGLIGTQKALFKINLGSDNWKAVLKAELELARTQFDKNRKKGIFHGFAHDPYSMISTIMRKEIENEEIDQIIIDEFIPLAIDVLNSEADVRTKEPCVACLCEILGYFEKRNVELSEDLKSALQAVHVEEGRVFFPLATKKTLEIRILMSKIIVGVTDISSLFQWCVEFGSLEIKEKIVIIDCLEKYLFYRKNNTEEINSLLISIVLQCSSEDNSEIRTIATRCLAYLVSSSYRDVAINALNKAVYDPSDKVRITLLNLCKTEGLPEELSNSLTQLLCNDANYVIRKRASELNVFC